MPYLVWLVGDFLCECMFWENSGGGLTTQPVGTATMTTVTSANRVDLESLTSRCWMFRRTHTSADPIRVLCTRLALQYFQYAHFIPIVGVGKRGEY